MSGIDTNGWTVRRYIEGLRPRNFSFVPANPEFETELRKSLQKSGTELTEAEMQKALNETRKALHRECKLVKPILNIMGDHEICIMADSLTSGNVQVAFQKMHEKPTDL